MINMSIICAKKKPREGLDLLLIGEQYPYCEIRIDEFSSNSYSKSSRVGVKSLGALTRPGSR